MDQLEVSKVAAATAPVRSSASKNVSCFTDRLKTCLVLSAFQTSILPHVLPSAALIYGEST